jgi:hypothetical protein
MIVAVQKASQEGPEKAARYLLGHAVAASTLETFHQLEWGLDQSKLAKLAEGAIANIKARLK